MAQSPLNYTGGKYKLLPQLLPLFPRNIHTFVDLFCGGGDVGTNVQSEHVILNDINTYVIGILQAFRNMTKGEIERFIDGTITHYGLSSTSEQGYTYYGCDSQRGLGNYNREPYLRLRNDFNLSEQKDSHYYLMLYVLVIYAFNNQIRFNSKGCFNLPVGKRDFNHKMRQKLFLFIDQLQKIDCTLSCFDFREIKTNNLQENDFVYADPPYLITCASYNEQGKWSENMEIALYNYMDELHTNNIRFAVSNVLKSKGKENTILRDWINANPQYRCHHLNKKYNNSNYHIINRDAPTDEVLVVNY